MPEDGEYGVWHYPHIGELEQWLRQISDIAVESLKEEDHKHADYIDHLNMVNLVVHEEWGRGLATPGKDILKLFMAISDPDDDQDEHMDPKFQGGSRAWTQRMVTIINDKVIDEPPEFWDWFTGVDIQPVAASRYESQLNLALGTADGNRIYDMRNGVAIEHRDGVSFERLPRVPLEELVEEDTEDEEEEEPALQHEEPIGPEQPDIEDEEEEDEEERLAELYPGIPPHLRQTAVNDDKLEVPVGNKDTKTVEPRPPYDFEIIQATGVPNPEFLDDVEMGYQADTSIQADVMDGIGSAKRQGRFDPNHPNTTSPGTYPRTGVYIRNHLKFEGPSYPLDMFKDFAIYCQMVNAIWDYNLRIGTYQSFRNFIHTLKKIPEAGGPALIRGVTEDEVDEYDLDILADHPKVEGRKAPWLENRRYYLLIEANEDHDAWNNPYDYLHGGD